MALSYDDSSTGIFTHIGKLIEYINSYATDITNLESDRDDIQDTFDAGDMNHLTTGLFSLYESAIGALTNLRSALAQIAEERLRDRVTVINELNLPGDGIQEVLNALITQMVSDSEDVDASVVTVGSVSANAGNSGDGTVFVTKVLDGVTEPGFGFPAHLEYDGKDSELAVSETMTLICTSDEDSGGATAGEETFSWHGEIPKNDPWSTESEGSGSGPSVTVLNAETLITNKDFEEFTTANTPDDWTLVGTAGTHILEESTEVFRGSSSVEFVGDGSEATIGLTQAIDPTTLIPRKRYLFSIAVKADAGITNGDLTIQFTGTGYTASSSEKISIAAASLPTDWEIKSFYINLPASLPDNWTLSIAWGNTPDSAKHLYLDSIAFGEVTYFGGVGLAIVAGADQFIQGDKFTFALTNGGEGTINTFFRRAFNCMLPSVTDNSESISDTLAE